MSNMEITKEAVAISGNGIQKYDKTSFEISRLITRSFSTSFYSATGILEKDIREGIFSIYGFVRLADEIVDSFHDHDKDYLLNKFESDYYDALKHGISLNPVLHSFQRTVKKYHISSEHVDFFLSSMKKDLLKKEYSDLNETKDYIYGSADVIGLMCLRVFCKGDDKLYRELEKPAMSLGSAFQKVNFLRDLRDDMEVLGRRYFSYVGESLSEPVKKQIIADIKNDFDNALTGLKKLPENPKLAVYIAYSYYLTLLKKIEQTPAKSIMEKRIRISNATKFYILAKAILYNKLKLYK